MEILQRHWQTFEVIHFAERTVSLPLCRLLPSSCHSVLTLSQGRLMGISTSQTHERPAYNDRELQKIILMLRENNANLITLSY